MSLMQTSWATQLNPLLSNPLSSGNLLKGIILSTGANTVNHLLSKKMQGWVLSDVDAAVTIYRSQPMNDKTLTLTVSADCVVNLYVF